MNNALFNHAQYQDRLQDHENKMVFKVKVGRQEYLLESFQHSQIERFISR